jgi:hypothetical protein
MPDSSDSTFVPLAIPAGVTVTVIDTRIGASEDDVEERPSGRMYLTSSDLELVQDKHMVQTVGLRFTDLDIPAGAVIVRAYLQFQTDEVGSIDTQIEIRGLASDDLSPFIPERYDLTIRDVTNALSAWSLNPWPIKDEVGADQRSPDLSAVVQEIVGREGWEAGNDLGFSITGSGKRTAESFDGDPAKAPVLHVEYYVPQASTPDILFARDPGFRENVAGATVGSLSLAAAIPGQTYVFSTSDDRFQLVGSTLKLRDDLRLDFERDSVVSVEVTATDSVGLAHTETITAAVGDVAETRFAAFGDYGNREGSADVAALVDALKVDFIITVGDNSYGSEAIDDQIGRNYSDYIGNYRGAYGDGSATNRFFPTLGNHEYDGDGGGVGAYLDYYTLPGNERYYDFVVGPVHFFALNSNPEEPNGISETSVQADWLQAGLAASTSLYNIVYFHHPPFSSGSEHGSTAVMQWPFEEWGATAVISGHDHDYERILRDDDGDGDSLAYFVSGLGGHSHYAFGSPVSGSVARYNADDGTMLVQASDESITFEFIATSGGVTGTIIDSFTIDLASLSAASAAFAKTEAFAAGDPSLTVEPVGYSDPLKPMEPIDALTPTQMDYFVWA